MLLGQCNITAVRATGFGRTICYNAALQACRQASTALPVKETHIMTITEGDRIPACTLKTMGEKGPSDISTEEIFAGKKVVLFAVPGAFTPGCTVTHLPGFVVQADSIKAKGVDTIACVSVNDAWVMDAWGKSQNADELLMLADGNGEFTAALGLELDASGFGLGKRSQRYALIAENGVVTSLNVEPGAGIDVSSADSILKKL